MIWIKKEKHLTSMNYKIKKESRLGIALWYFIAGMVTNKDRRQQVYNSCTAFIEEIIKETNG